MNPKHTILLTGVTGFIAKHVCLELLNAGYSVVGTLRRADRAEEVRGAIAAHLPDRASIDTDLRFVELDLMQDAGWPEAMQGIDAVLHTASPFPMAQPRNPQDVIRPAVDGTLRVLRAAQGVGVRRVVLTSSTSAILYCDKGDDLNRSEEDWTDINHPAATPYAQSKTLAERAAWEFAAQNAGMRLTVINPGLVTGRPLDPHYGTSLRIVERFMSGKDPFAPNFGLPLVDVADVAATHVAALRNDATVGQRFLTADSFLMAPEMTRHLAALYPDRGVPTRVAPSLLIRMLSLFDRELRSIVPMLGERLEIRNARARDVLGIRFTPALDSLAASAAYIDARRAG